jgi:hypothetical protein
MSDFVKVDVRGISELQRKFEELPYGTKRIAIQGATDYLIGNETHGLKWYPVPMGQKYVRTYNLRANWTRQGSEYQPKIVNYAPYAVYVPGRWKKYGWREWMTNIHDNMDGAIRHAQALVNQYLKGWNK